MVSFASTDIYKYLNIYRHLDGVGTAAKFNTIHDLEYVTPRNKVIVSDHKNNCLREFDRQTLVVERFAGQCRSPGDVDGDRLDAKLNSVLRTVYDATHNLLYIAERDTGKLRILDFETMRIRTWKTLSPSTHLMDITIPPEGVNHTILLNDDSVLQLSGSEFAVISKNQTVETNNLKRIHTLTSTIHAIIDFEKGITILDTSITDVNKRLTLCSKDGYNPASDILNCSWIGEVTTASTLVNNSLIFVLADVGEIKVKTVKGKWSGTRLYN